MSVSAALALGSVAYAGVILGLQIPEARQILDLFARTWVWCFEGDEPK